MARSSAPKYSKGHHGDWVVNCDICAAPVWFLETKLLTWETGFPGLRVCKYHRTDYVGGMVPWYMWPEQPVEDTRVNFSVDQVIDSPGTIINFDNPSSIYENPPDDFVDPDAPIPGED